MRILTLLLFISTAVCAQRTVKDLSPEEYIPKTVILKLKPEYKTNGHVTSIELPMFNSLYKSIQGKNLVQKYAFVKAPKASEYNSKEKLVDLSLIYEFNYDANVPLVKVLSLFESTGLVEYAEPHLLAQLCAPKYLPNDPRTDTIISSGRGDQSANLNNIRAYEAWFVQKGDTNVVIGVSDTGVDIFHEDLYGNIKYNYNDPIDGIDNDFDGYVDNFRGWDLGDHDNNPQATSQAHGVAVSGLACATTDNNIGMAGTGFKCKLLPLKIDDTSGGLSGGYESMVYGAEHGCKVINCSWGTPGYFSKYGNDIVNFAVLNKNCNIICAAGNGYGGNYSIPWYPASYKNALSVANVKLSGVKDASSTYNVFVDISAPGEGLFSTWIAGATPGNIPYIGGPGVIATTSYCTPLVSGAAGLLRAQFPTYHAIQINELLKSNAYLLDTISGNASYVGELGRGRLDMFRALTQNPNASVIATEESFTDNNNDIFTVGEIIYLNVKFKNFLAGSGTVNVTCQSSAPSFLTVLNPVKNLGIFSTMQEKDNYSSPFQLMVNSAAPQNTTVSIRLTITDGVFTNYEYYDVTINENYVNVAVNDVATSITGRGKSGFNQNGGYQGLGFTYKDGYSMLYESGFMMAASSIKVSDNIRNTTGWDSDLQNVSQVVNTVPPLVSDFDVTTVFNDNGAGTSKLSIEVQEKVYAWNTPADSKYVMFTYQLVNKGAVTYNDLFAGVFTDWDIISGEYNKAAYDAVNRLGYTYSTENGSLYGGVMLLSKNAGVRHYAIDNSSLPNTGINITDANGYSTTDKFVSLTTFRNAAGSGNYGNDVCQVVSTGPLKLAVNDTVEIAFAMLAGDDLTDLKVSAAAAQKRYDGMTKVGLMENLNDNNLVPLLLLTNYPNPVSGDETIRFYAASGGDVELILYNTNGQMIHSKQYTAKSGIQNISFNASSLADGIYFVTLKKEEHLVGTKFSVLR